MENNNIKTIIHNQREFFVTDETKSIEYRTSQLKALLASIKKHEKEISAALKKDLNKSEFESYETEIGIVLHELRTAIRKLAKWNKPEKVKTPITLFHSRSYEYHDPYGVVLIMSPWNYPFQLTMMPLIGSIAAGNCSVVKPSEYSFYTSNIIEKIIRETFDEKYIAVMRGGREANKNIMGENFDYIFFTGSPAVGHAVMEAAARNLTPVTLELGGKSPCIVDNTADIDIAARRIIWGKLINAGQTCIAPDYLLVQEDIKDKLIGRMKKYICEFYGGHPENCEYYPKIINEKHFSRLQNLLKDGNILYGGNIVPERLTIAPTLVDNIDWDSPVMKEEIFGPIFPIMSFKNFEDILPVLKQKPKPLALYLFTTDNEHKKVILNNISFGGGCINDTITHIANSRLPFGGVGNSGTGQYHGKASFETFTHKKAVVKKYNYIDIALRYPPFKNNIRLLKKIMK